MLMKTATATADTTGKKGKRMQEVVRRELERLTKRNGELEPTDVVSAARDPSNPLHQAFEEQCAGIWNDGVAAELARLEVAGTIIRQYKLEVTVTKTPHRQFKVTAYVRNPVKGKGRKHVSAIKKSKEEVRSELLTECRQLLGVATRVMNLATYWERGDVAGPMEQVVGTVTELVECLDKPRSRRAA
jgi:hypothetical protein